MKTGVVYHGTTVKGLETLSPKPSEVIDGKSAVFASTSLDASISFAIPWSDDDFVHGMHNDTQYMRERKSGNFERFFAGKPIYVYELPNTGFHHDTRLLPYEVINENPVSISGVREYPDAYEALKKTGYVLIPFGTDAPWDKANTVKGAGMNRRDYLIAAIQAEKYRERQWVYSVFTVVRHPVEYGKHQIDIDWADELSTDYNIVQDPRNPHAVFFIDPDNDGELTMLEDASWDQPIYRMHDRIVLQPGDMDSVFKTIETRVGNVLINAMTVYYAYRGKLPFLTGQISVDKLENILAKRTRDNPQPGESRSDEELYVDELIRYCDGMTMVGAYADIDTPGQSPRSMIPNPDVIKRRDELFEIHKHELHDPAVFAAIEKELIELDKAGMKGDEAEGFYVDSKSWTVQRKARFITQGIQTGFDTNVAAVSPILPSLTEGWDMSKFPEMVDGIAAGSYNRGLLTALGGETVKYFYRIFQNATVAMDDCGSPYTLPLRVTDTNKAYLIGRFYIPDGGKEAVRLTESIVAENHHKYLRMRSPAFCRVTGSSFCARCLGSILSNQKTGLPLAAAEVGTVFMLNNMKAMHGKALQVQRYDPTLSIT